MSLIPSNTFVSPTEGYTYLVQGPFSVAPCRTLIVRFATNSSLCAGEGIAGDFPTAVTQFSMAIRLDKYNYVMWSNRSAALCGVRLSPLI